jgi:GTPase
VLNKIDVAGIEPGAERDESGILQSIRLSALTGIGCAALRAALAERFPADAPLSEARVAPLDA